jgi:hypothetical protein
MGPTVQDVPQELGHHELECVCLSNKYSLFHRPTTATTALYFVIYIAADTAAKQKIPRRDALNPRARRALRLFIEFIPN